MIVPYLILIDGLLEMAPDTQRQFVNAAPGAQRQLLKDSTWYSEKVC